MPTTKPYATEEAFETIQNHDRFKKKVGCLQSTINFKLSEVFRMLMFGRLIDGFSTELTKRPHLVPLKNVVKAPSKTLLL